MKESLFSDASFTIQGNPNKVLNIFVLKSAKIKDLFFFYYYFFIKRALT